MKPSKILTKMDILNYESLSLYSSIEPMVFKKESEFCEMLVDLCMKQVITIKQEISIDAAYEVDDLIHATRLARSYVENFLNSD